MSLKYFIPIILMTIVQIYIGVRSSVVITTILVYLVFLIVKFFRKRNGSIREIYDLTLALLGVVVGFFSLKSFSIDFYPYGSLLAISIFFLIGPLELYFIKIISRKFFDKSFLLYSFSDLEIKDKFPYFSLGLAISFVFKTM